VQLTRSAFIKRACTFKRASS